MIRALIAAINPEGVIGRGDQIPWHYPADLARFKRLTIGQTVIMGRKTYESIGRPLPRRKNIVVTRRDIAGVRCVRSQSAALAEAEGEVWFIGGRRIYEEAMEHADFIDLTLVPDDVEGEELVYFPPIDPEIFEANPPEAFADDPRLRHQTYRRKASRSAPQS